MGFEWLQVFELPVQHIVEVLSEYESGVTAGVVAREEVGLLKAVLLQHEFAVLGRVAFELGELLGGSFQVAAEVLAEHCTFFVRDVEFQVEVVVVEEFREEFGFEFLEGGHDLPELVVELGGGCEDLCVSEVLLLHVDGGLQAPDALPHVFELVDLGRSECSGVVLEVACQVVGNGLVPEHEAEVGLDVEFSFKEGFHGLFGVFRDPPLNA